MNTGQCVVCNRKRGGYDGGTYVYDDARQLAYVCGVCCDTIPRCEWCGERDLIMETVVVVGRGWDICSRCIDDYQQTRGRAFMRVELANDVNIRKHSQTMGFDTWETMSNDVGITLGELVNVYINACFDNVLSFPFNIVGVETIPLLTVSMNRPYIDYVQCLIDADGNKWVHYGLYVE